MIGRVPFANAFSAQGSALPAAAAVTTKKTGTTTT